MYMYILAISYALYVVLSPAELFHRNDCMYEKCLPHNMIVISGVARIFRWGGGGQYLKKGTCINSKQVILACRECSGAYNNYSHHYLLEGGSGGSPPENFFLKCFKMVHFHGSSIIMLLLGAYIWALGQYGINTLKVLLQ